MTVGRGVVGQVQSLALNLVKPNPWNPNRLNERTWESLKHGLEHDGWISSQALLIWGKDDKGTPHNLIIDGEHRWRAATELGFTHGPMVVLDGLTESQAKALTIKMDARRGTFDAEDLGDLLREIQFDFDGDDLGLELGFGDDDMAKLLAEPPDTLPAPAPAPPGVAPAVNGTAPPIANIRLVQLFFDGPGHEAFTREVAELGKRLGTKTVTETISKLVHDAAAASVSG
jgi:ParB-like chromosome segregation protein Spo0J